MNFTRADLSGLYPWLGDPRISARLPSFSPMAAKVDRKSETVDIYLDDVIVDPEIEKMFGVGVSAQGFRQNQLAQADGARLVRLHINSPGGDVHQASSMLAGLRDLKVGRRETYIDGIAASAATLVALGGDRILMQPEAEFMIHEASGGGWGTVADHLKFADLLRKSNDMLVAAYTKRTGLPEDRIRQMLVAQFPGGTFPGTFMNATEAKDLGFVDEVTGKAEPVRIAAEFRAEQPRKTHNQLAVQLAYARSQR